MEYNYDSDLKIDKHHLDEEFLQQPRLFMKWTKIAARAKKEMDEAQERLKILRSELILEYKSEYKAATNPQIEAYYRTDKRYIDAKQELIDAEFNMNVMNDAKYAFIQRKTSLEYLYKQWADEYYSDPRNPENVDKSAIDRIRKKVSGDKIKQHLGKRTNKIQRSRRTK